MKKQTTLLLILIAAMFVLAACGSEEAASTPVVPTETAVPTNPPTPAPTETPTPIPTPTTIPSPTPIPAEDLVEEGDAHLIESEWDEAIAAYEMAIDIHEDPIAYAHLGYLHQASPDTREDGLEIAQQAADLAPDNAEVMAYLAWAQIENNLPDDGLATAENAVALDAENALAHTVLAIAYLSTNQYDSAIASAEQAVELDADFPFAQINLASTYIAVNRYDEAIAAAAKGYAAQPHYVPFAVRRAYFFGVIDDTRNKFHVLNDALDLDETFIPALSELADYHRDEEEYDVALALCDQIVEINPELPHGYSCRGFTYLDRELYDEATESFDLAIDRDVEATDGYFGRGRVLLDQDDCTGSRAEFEKVSTLRPYNSFMHSFIGLTYNCEGEYAAAIESYQTAVSMNPYSSFAVYGLGQAYMNEERYEDAEAEFRTAVELEQGISPYPHIGLGGALFEQGKHDEAEEAFLAAVAIDDENIDVFLALGDFYIERDRYYDAEDQFEAALALDEESTQALLGLGYALALSDRCGTALQYFDQARDLDPDNFVASDLYNQCYTIWRYDNPPGPVGDVINEGTAVSLATSAVVNRIGIPGEAAFAEFRTGENGRMLIVAYVANYDPNTHPTEFANEINAAMFAATDAFVRTDSAPIILIVQAFAIQGQEVVFLGSRGTHRTDAVDWWNSTLSDGGYIGKWFSE